MRRAPIDRFPLYTSIGAGAILTAVVAHANGAAQRGDGVLAGAGPAVEGLVAAGATLYGVAAAAAPALGAAAAVLLVGVAGRALRRRRWDGASPLAASLALAVLAQGALLEAWWYTGAALYVAAALALALANGSARAAAAAPRWPAAPDACAHIAFLALFVALGAYRLDVLPDLYYDEVAYVTAARMQIGELARGEIAMPQFTGIYDFERFQAQAAPLALHAGAVALLAPGVLPVRLAALAAGLLALVVAGATVRRHFGSPVALGMLACASASPLLLGYARLGAYVSMSVLHGALCLAATLALCERERPGRAVLLGLLLGSSVYFYQVSWTVPVLALAALLAARGLRPWRASVRLLAVVGASAALGLAPAAIWLQEGLGAVLGQTFDARAVFEGERAIESVTRAEPLGAPELAELEAELRPLRVRVRPLPAARGAALAVMGAPHAAGDALDRLEGRGFTRTRSRLLLNLDAMIAGLLYAPSVESAGRRVREPLLTSLLAPLVVVGLAEALRRRREPRLRALAVWVVLGALLPGAFGTAFPRRAVLMLPFVYALVALPLAGRWAASAGVRRRAAACAAALLAAAAVCAGSFAYFERWHPSGTGGGALLGSYLELAQLLRRVPRGDLVLVEPVLPGLATLLRNLEEESLRGGERQLKVRRRGETPERVRAASCRFGAPLTWIVSDAPSRRALFAGLDTDFEVEAGVHPPFRTLRLVRLRPGGCR